MIRFGIKITTNGIDPRWISIGTGNTPDIQHAHLYTTEDLALAKIKSEKKAHHQWEQYTGNTLQYEVVKFNVESIDQ